MVNFDDVTKKNMKNHNPNWPQVSGHPYRVLIVGGSGSGKAKLLFNLISHQPDIYKIYSYVKDPYDEKYQLLVTKTEGIGLKLLNDSKTLIEYLIDMNNICENIEEYNPNVEPKIMIVFDDIIADMLINKKLNPIVTELFIRGRKLNISFLFITQSYFVVPKNIRLNSTQYFIMKIPNKR